MKKAILSISFICYQVITSGIVINSHYCMNRLASTDLFGAEVKQCGSCGMDMHQSNSCCKDEMKFVKLVQDQTVHPLISYSIPSLEAIIGFPSLFIETNVENDITQHHFLNHSPPLLSEQDTYLRNNVFRI